MLNDIESVNYEIFRGIAGKQCHWCHFTSINQKWTKILWGWFYLRRELFLTIKWGRLWVNKFFSLFNIYYMSNKNKKYVWCNLEKQNILTNNIFLKKSFVDNESFKYAKLTDLQLLTCLFYFDIAFILKRVEISF